MNETDNQDYWLEKAASLRVDRKQGIATHKPLLLLVLAGLAEEGLLPQPELPLTGELTFRFLAFSTVVARRRTQRPDVRLPFFHMGSDGLWTPLDRDGRPAQERRSAVLAEINPFFHACFGNAGFRERLRRIVIAKYFADPAERSALYNLMDMPLPPEDIAKADARLYSHSSKCGREARFRLTVVPAYNYTCALTGYRCVTVDAGSIVNAAHIHQFADSRNNHPQNGLALSKNAHWLFDQGLWSLTDDFVIIVAEDRFHESGEEALLITRAKGKRIVLPGNPNYWPDRRHLAWHRWNKLGRMD